MFLTDDAAARLVAIQMGFNVHGKSPNEVLDILKIIPYKTTLYIRHSLLQEIQLKIKSEFNL